MDTHSLTHLSDPVLLRSTAALLSQDRITTAALLAHLAEIDARKLFLPEGFPSMYAFCVGMLRFSEQSAMKRIRAARTARRFPAIFDAIAQGRLHLSAVVLLAPHLTPENMDELLAAATHQCKAEIEQLLARRFPRPDVPTRLEPLAPPPLLGSASEPLSPGTVESGAAQVSPGTVEAFAPARFETPVPRPRVVPLAPQRFALQFTIGKDTHDMLEYAQALLSHAIPWGNVAIVFHRALKTLIPQLEKQKFAATGKPRPRSCRSSANARHIPADVKRAVWQRDQGQCTYVSATGHRCGARKLLEFDHIDPVALGGQATVERMRLRCRGHNQFEAERTFGAEFMRHKREAAREAAAEARARAARVDARERAAAAEQAKENNVIPWLRGLGFRADEARRAAALCETIPDASLEERVRVALSYFHPRTPPTACGEPRTAWR